MVLQVKYYIPVNDINNISYRITTIYTDKNVCISPNGVTENEPIGRIHTLPPVAKTSSQCVHQSVCFQRHQSQRVFERQRETETSGNWALHLQVSTRSSRYNVRVL